MQVLHALRGGELSGRDRLLAPVLAEAVVGHRHAAQLSKHVGERGGRGDVALRLRDDLVAQVAKAPDARSECGSDQECKSETHRSSVIHYLRSLVGTTFAGYMILTDYDIEPLMSLSLDREARTVTRPIHAQPTYITNRAEYVKKPHRDAR